MSTLVHTGEVVISDVTQVGAKGVQDASTALASFVTCDA
jgi:hypothetical protein